MIRIRCARCNKPVDRWEWRDDHVNFRRIVRAFCHGEVDTMTIRESDLMRLSSQQLKALEDSEGVAFEPKLEVAR